MLLHVIFHLCVIPVLEISYPWDFMCVLFVLFLGVFTISEDVTCI